MTRLWREIAAPFIAAAPGGARVRARLRLSAEDEAVLRAVGARLGSLAGRDLAARCREGRLAVPAGHKRGPVRGYATPAERHGKRLRLDALKGRLAAVERQLGPGMPSVVRGGKRLLGRRGNLTAAGLTQEQWRREWDAARMFLTADGEKDKAWGNETIRWNPDERWLELKLPAPLASLANRPRGRYRLSCEAAFSYRGDEVAAQAASGAIRYDISADAASGRWHLAASWKLPRRPVPSLDNLREHPVTAVDVNAGHLAVAVVLPDGNVSGTPHTIPLQLAGLPATARDGRVRAAVSDLIATAKKAGAQAIVIEDLDFAEARAEGREKTGSRPSRGRRGRRFRHLVAGIPTARFRDRLTQMTANAGLHVVVIDPAYTSRWGAEHWLAPLRAHHPKTTGHHAAALVIGRRGQGHRARIRATGNRPVPEETARPAQARPRDHPPALPAPSKHATPPGRRPPHRGKTGPPHGTLARDQAAEDRPRLPAEPTPTIAQ